MINVRHNGGARLGRAGHNRRRGVFPVAADPSRAAVLQLAFQGLGAQQAVSAAFEGNPASLRVSRKLGYRDDGIEWHVCAAAQP